MRQPPTGMFRLQVPLAYLRRSPCATLITRCAIGVAFKLLDARNRWVDRSLP